MLQSLPTCAPRTVNAGVAHPRCRRVRGPRREADRRGRSKCWPRRDRARPPTGDTRARGGARALPWPPLERKPGHRSPERAGRCPVIMLKSHRRYPARRSGTSDVHPAPSPNANIPARGRMHEVMHG